MECCEGSRVAGDQADFAPSNFVLTPTMACQASCVYCFALTHGHGNTQDVPQVMPHEVLDAAVDVMYRVAPTNGQVEVTFHGGEPLLAGEAYFRHALMRLRKRFGRRLRLGIQSNLWALTEDLAELFSCYEVRVGTSVDGPRDLCDAQRGAGAYERTMAGMEMLRAHGVEAHAICTLASSTAHRAAEVFSCGHGPYAIHGAVPMLGLRASKVCVDASLMKRILLDSYDAYRADAAHARITTIDTMARGVLRGCGQDCTFGRCLGTFAAVGPDGSIYPCQRFVGHGQWSLGNVLDVTSADDVMGSEAYARLLDVVAVQERACAGCEHHPYCNGGCPYQALTAGTDRDPYCEAYAATFERISRDMAVEMGSLLLDDGHDTPTLAMAGERPHPFERRRKERAIRLALAKGASPCADGWLRRQYPENDLNKFYLHLTFACPLRCAHCYAEGGERACAELSPERLASIVEQACEARFRSVVVTGGEPLAYGGFDKFCELVSHLDRMGTRLVLRTSLGFLVDQSRLASMCALFDEVVVSVDGDRVTHDARRGAGRYDMTVKNLKRIVDRGYGPKLSLAATLSREQGEGEPGDSVRSLAATLGGVRLRIRPVLPLGRAMGVHQESWQLCLGADCDPLEQLKLRGGCGLGQNLYVMPDGSVYPCYAWCEPNARLGDLSHENLDTLLGRGELFAYCAHDVDANESCRTCHVRYLCGGMCRAWVADRSNVDSGSFDCSSRKAYLQEMVARLDV